MNHSLQHQRGAALLVALVILVMITLLAITASRFTLLGTRSSLNFQLHNSAFQAAEIALSDGIEFIDGGGAHPAFFPLDENGELTNLIEVGTSGVTTPDGKKGPFPSTTSYVIEPPKLVPDGGDSMGEGRGLPKKYRYVLVGSANVTDHNVRSSIEQGISKELIGD